MSSRTDKQFGLHKELKTDLGRRPAVGADEILPVKNHPK